MEADHNAPVDGTALTLQGPQHSGPMIVSTKASWGGLLRRRFTTTLKTAIDTGLARLQVEAERRATP